MCRFFCCGYAVFRRGLAGQALEHPCKIVGVAVTHSSADILQAQARVQNQLARLVHPVFVQVGRKVYLKALLEQLAEVAIADLKRIGVSDRFLTDCADPIIKEAVLTYINANFGNSPESERLTASYNMLLTKIKGGRYFDE